LVSQRFAFAGVVIGLAALCGCASGSGGETGRGRIRVEAPSTPQPAASVGPFGGIAAPADLARSSSATTPLRGARGADFDSGLGSSRCAAEGRYGVFTPDFSPGAADLGGLAFAIYRLQVSPNNELPRLDWGTEDGSALSDCWFGLSDFERNRWVWFGSSDPGLKALAPLTRFIHPDTGEMFVAVVFAGRQERRLKFLRLGDNLPPVAILSATPDYGVIPLDIHLDASASYDIDGEIATYSFWCRFDEQSTPSPSPTYDIAADSISQSAHLSIYDDENNPASVVVELALCDTGLSVYPNHGMAELPAILSTNPSCEDRQIVSCEFDPEGDGIFEFAGQESWTNFVYSVPGDYQATARLVDDEGHVFVESQPVSVQADDGQARWRAVRPNGLATYGSMLALVGGRPAMCFFGSDSTRLVYQRAGNPLGTLWGSAKVVAYGASRGSGVLSMAEIAGLPAVLYMKFNGDAGSLCYRRAADLDGSSWSGESVVRDWDKAAWVFATLLDLNGQPAVASIDMASEGPEYVRALDPDGSVWGAPVSLWLLGGSGISMAIVNGSPAISFAYGGIYYTRSLDANGAGWPAPSQIATSASGSWFQSLAVLDGKPAVAYCSTGEGGVEGDQEALLLVRSADASGTSGL
jgi:hypothetical protein